MTLNEITHVSSVLTVGQRAPPTGLGGGIKKAAPCVAHEA